MKTKLLAVGGALLLALCASPVVAEILTVNMTAHIIQVYDPSNILGGQLSEGQPASGRYSYETTAPDQSPDQFNELGWYVQSPQQGRVSFTMGPLKIESDAASPNWSFFVETWNLWGPPRYFLYMNSDGNKPLPSGASVSNIGINLSDMSANRPWADALPSGAPDIASFQDAWVTIWGTSPATGEWYSVSLRIDSAEVAPAFQISPAGGSFVRQQRIHPALILQGSGELSAVRVSVNGVPLPAEYAAQCQVAPPNTQNRPAIVCPDIIPALAGGANHVEWSLDFSDGSTATRAVDWEMIE